MHYIYDGMLKILAQYAFTLNSRTENLGPTMNPSLVSVLTHQFWVTLSLLPAYQVVDASAKDLFLLLVLATDRRNV